MDNNSQGRVNSSKVYEMVKQLGLCQVPKGPNFTTYTPTGRDYEGMFGRDAPEGRKEMVRT